MERPSYKLVDRSAKLLQTILQEDLDTFTTILSEAKPDEVRTVVFVFITGGQKENVEVKWGSYFVNLHASDRAIRET